MLVSAFHIGPQLVILTIACAFMGWAPDPMGMLAVLLALMITMCAGTAIALLLSAANVFLRDVSNAVNILTNLVRFGVPMIYPYVLVEERFGSFADFYLLNPLANAVLLLQRGFWVGTTTDPEETAATDLPDNLFTFGLISLGCCLILLAVGQLVFSRLENKIPERL